MHWLARAACGHNNKELIMRLKLLIKVVAVCAAITGCVYTDRSEDYQRSASLPSILLPEDVNSTPLEPLYPIPEVPRRMDALISTDIGGDAVPRPEPMSAEREAAKVKIQKVDGREWVLVEAPPSQVWPLAQSYLTQTGISVARSDAASGLIETDWVQFKTDDSLYSNYRIRIEKGVRVETTEIHVLHHQSETKTLEAWPATSMDADKERWLLEGVANSLAERVGNKAASLLGQSVGGESKAEVTMLGSEPVLVLRLDKARAWASLAHGIQSDGFIRWAEQDKDGLVYFQFTGDYQRPNWFIRLFTWGENAPVTEAPVSLSEALAHLVDSPDAKALFSQVEGAQFGDPLEKGAGYLMLVSPSEDMSAWVARLRRYDGAEVESDRAKLILAYLRRNLI